MDIATLWKNGNKSDWEEALKAYYKIESVKENCKLEDEMNNINPTDVQQMDAQEFYNFLYEDYFVWKYTANNRRASTRRYLKLYENDKQGLRNIQISIFKLFEAFPEDTDILLFKTQQIHGLGTAGASGLLAILFPQYYGTIDQFVVKNLQSIEDLPERSELVKMKPENLTIKDGVVIERILRSKAAELNKKFTTNEWTPRKIDMVLWSYGRD